MSIFRWKPEEIPEEYEQNRPPRRGERMERDLKKLLLSGLLAFLGGLPFVAGVSFAIVTHTVFPLLVAGILGGMIAAPEVCGLVDTVLRSLRDDPSPWGLTYSRAWKQNVKASLIPGALFGLILGSQIFAAAHVGLMDYPGFQLISLCLVCLLLFGIGAYLFPLLVLMDLPFGALVKNSILLFLRNITKSLPAAFLLFVFFGAILLWFPITLVVLLLGGMWVPVFFSCRIVYPLLDREFHLSEAFAAMK